MSGEWKSETAEFPRLSSPANIPIQTLIVNIEDGAFIFEDKEGLEQRAERNILPRRFRFLKDQHKRSMGVRFKFLGSKRIAQIVVPSIPRGRDCLFHRCKSGPVLYFKQTEARFELRVQV